MMGTKRKIKIPQKTVAVSQARSQLPRLLRHLRAAPRIYWITQSGKPAGALVSQDWLHCLLDQASGRKPFSIFGHDWVAPDWEQALKEIRKSVVDRTIERWDRVNRQNP